MVFLSYYDGVPASYLRALVDSFNEGQHDIAVSLQFAPFHVLKQRIVTGTIAGDLPDVTIIDNPDNAAFAEEGVFADLTDRVARWEGNGNFFPGPWNSTLYRGRQYGIPFTSNCLALYYNKTLLGQAGLKVPETWDELRAAAKKLTTPDRFGLAISAINSEEGTFQYLPWFLSSGANIARLDSPEAQRSLEFLRSLITDGSMSQEVINWSMNDLEKQFSGGKAAMMINGPWHIGTLEHDAPAFPYGLAKVPRDRVYASVLGGENIAIIKNDKVNASWTFVQYLCSRETIDRFTQLTGDLPPRSDVLKPGENGKHDPQWRVFLDQMPYALPRGPHPQWPQISALISGALQEGLSGFQTPQKALADAQRRLSDLPVDP